jgi:putative transposase
MPIKAMIKSPGSGESGWARHCSAKCSGRRVVDVGHLLAQYPPKVAVSNLVNSLKGVSRRLLCKERPDIQKRFWSSVLWSPSYTASTCGGALISYMQ